jgi:hypothetical protein
MTYDKSAEADIRGIDIDKLAKGFGQLTPTFKNFCNQAKTKAREIRWYRKGISLATAMNPLDTPTTQGVTTSRIANTSFKARPFVVELAWERETSYVKKYFVESPWISLEDIKDCDVDILAGNVQELVRAVHFKIDRRIYDVLTEATTSGTPNPTTVNDTAATDGWGTTATCNPILDLLNAKQEIKAAGYDPEGAICLMNELEEKNLLNFLINVKGSSIPAFAGDKVKSGVVMELLGLKIVTSPQATADWVITFVPKKAITWKSFMPITTAVIEDKGVAKKIRVWEEGEALLTDPLAVHVLSGAS